MSEQDKNTVDIPATVCSLIKALKEQDKNTVDIPLPVALRLVNLMVELTLRKSVYWDERTNRLIADLIKSETELKSLASESRNRCEQELRKVFERLIVVLVIDYMVLDNWLRVVRRFEDRDAFVVLATLLSCDCEVIKEIVLGDKMYRIALPSLYKASTRLVVTTENMLQLIDEIKNGQKEKIDELERSLLRFADDVYSIAKSLKRDQHE